MDGAVVRRAAVAIGSNLGDRAAAILFATDRLTALMPDLVVSDAVETYPDGEGLEDQPLYLNAVAVGHTSLTARALLDALLAIEQAYGRDRPYPGAPRTLDLDLILLGDADEQAPGLHVPHPRFRERFFVLGPMAEVAPDLVDPVSGMRVGELLKKLLREK